MGLKPIACHQCGCQWTFDPPMARRAECPQCRWDARVCANCRHFDRGAHHECREEQAEYVKEKTMGNFCTYFEPRASAEGPGEAAAAKDKLAALFGGQPEAPRAPAAGLAGELARFLSSKK